MTDSVNNEIHPNVLKACEIACGRQVTAPDGSYRVKGAHKDYSARGSCRAHWFRMVLRGGQWTYVSDEYLPSGNFRASERHATVYGEVYEGELCVTHDRGKGVDSIAHLMTVDPSDDSLEMIDCKVVKSRDGNLRIHLPSGDVVVAPNPRGK